MKDKSASAGPDCQDVAETMEAMKAFHRSAVWVVIEQNPLDRYKVLVTAYAQLLAPVPMQPATGLKISAPRAFVARSFPHPDHRTLEGCISYVLNCLDYKMAQEFWVQLPADFQW